MTKSEVATQRAFRILLIDDSKNGLLIRKSILEEHGFTVTAFSSPEEAVLKFEQSEFDLVITDYRMPALSGLEVIRRVRASRPQVPLILISGVADVLGLDESNTGADAVIPKSATEASHLIRAVNRLLRLGASRKPVASQQAKRSRATRSAK